MYIWRQGVSASEGIVWELIYCLAFVDEVLIFSGQSFLLCSVESVSRQLGPIGQAKARNGL